MGTSTKTLSAGPQNQIKGRLKSFAEDSITEGLQSRTEGFKPEQRAYIHIWRADGFNYLTKPLSKGSKPEKRGYVPIWRAPNQCRGATLPYGGLQNLAAGLYSHHEGSKPAQWAKIPYGGLQASAETLQSHTEASKALQGG